jgi:CubicO group peptidase (beta-lactamase class C family)
MATMRTVRGFALACGVYFAALAAAAETPPLPPADQQGFWTPEQQLVAFRSMSRLYGGYLVHHGDKVMPLPKAGREIDVSYRAEGADMNTARFMEHNRVSGLIVLHQGKIVLERYGLGRTQQDPWVSFSVAKSVTSTLVGAAIRDGSIKTVDDLVTQYIPELTGSGYRGVTIRQALEMAVGLRWAETYSDRRSDWGRTLSLDIPGDKKPGVDIIDYMAHLPREKPPGSVFLYDSGNVQILGIVVERATHKPLASYLEEKIWRPLGMEADGYWVRDRFSHAFARSLFNARLRDYARFGYFFMHGAKIDGTSILPDGWVSDATQSHLPTGWDHIGYGYLWWISPNGAYRAIGIYGQMIFLDPRADVVIVTNSAWPQADWDPGYDAVDAFNAAVVKAFAQTSNP